MKTNQPRQLRVSLAILYLPIALFLMGARSIVVALGGNPNYPTTFPTLAVVTAALDDLQAKIAAAAGHDKTAMAARDASWETAKGLVRQLASFVQMHCGNDLTILLSSGFATTKTPVSVGTLPAPGNPRLTRTDMSGQVLFRFSPVRGTTAGYLVQTATDTAGPFTDLVNSTRTRVTIEGRTPLSTMWARVRASGAAGPGPWSNPASVVVV